MQSDFRAIKAVTLQSEVKESLFPGHGHVDLDVEIQGSICVGLSTASAFWILRGGDSKAKPRLNFSPRL